MTPEERQELIELLDALTELAYGCMLQVGVNTATKVVHSAQNLKIILEENVASKT